MSGSVDISVTGSTDGFVASMVQAGSVTEREAQRIVKQIGYINSVLKDAEKAQRAAGNAAADIKKAGDAAAHATGPTAGFTRELIVMAHEASQGQFSRLGGSFLVLTERSATLTNVVHGLLGPMGAVLGAAAFLAVQIHRGAAESDAFNKSLILTGNYAGQTAASMHAMAESIAKTTGQTIGAAKEATQALVSSGAFGPGVMQQAGQAVVQLSHLTGQTSEEVVKDFAKMQDGVAKWAEEHNRTMHFLSAAQYEYIKDLETQGKTEEAERVTLAALNDRLSESTKNLGYFAQAWEHVKQSVSGAVDAINSLGRSNSIDQELAKAEERAKRLHASSFTNQGPLNFSDGFFMSQASIDKATKEADEVVAKLRESKALSDQVAASTADAQRRQVEGIAGSKVVEKINEEIDRRSVAIKKVEEYTAAVKKMRDAGDPKAPSAAQEAEAIAAIREKYRNESTKRLDTAFTDRLDSLRAEGIKLDAEIANWKKYGKAIDDSRLALINMEVAQGKLKGLSAAQINQLRTVAAADDEKARQLKAAEAAAQFTKTLAVQTAQVDKEVASLDAQRSLIGKTTLERQQAADAIKVQAEAEKLLAQNVGKEAEIHEWAAEQVRKLTQARERDYQSARQFTTGASNALAKYIEDATNQGKYADSLVTGSLQRWEDAIVQFADTGKLSFASLWKFMADEFIRQQVRMATAQLINGSNGSGGLGNAIGSLFGNYFSGNTGAATTTANAMPGDSLDNLINVTGGFGTMPSHASGLDYVPRDNYVANLHEGEAVLKKTDANVWRNGGDSGGVTVHNHIGSIGSNVSRSDLDAAMRASEARTQAAILQSRRHNGVFA